ncbi:hypothetical protein [Uruburuella suis]|uniref:hypothetical protein n=1 Tax=Uruburuella suis TaxID=252130 RepID=UPI00249121A4|nr:hypothetical protein [Uruburuella suis]
MQQRIIELATQSPCSIAYLADVLQQPAADIETELKKLVRQGRLNVKTVVLYRAEPTIGKAERALEQRIRRRIDRMMQQRGIAA